MFDPTIFDNLKVVIEGHIYDLEREGHIRILNRQDSVDLGNMSRRFRMALCLPTAAHQLAGIELSSQVTDFAAELIPLRIVDQFRPGCQIRLFYHVKEWTVTELPYGEMNQLLKRWWDDEVDIQQKVESTIHISDQIAVTNSLYTAEVAFTRKIDETNIDNLRELLDLLVSTLHELRKITESDH